MKKTKTFLFSQNKAGRLLGLLSLCGIHFAAGAQSSAGSGDIAIYSETTGTDTITTAAGVTHDFDTTVREDTGSFTLSGSDITLNRAGHYLAIYNSRFDATAPIAPPATSEQRVEIQSHLNLGGADLASGWSQGYIRRQENQDETITSGMAIFEAAASDVLQLRSFRTDNLDAGTVTRVGGNTGIQLIKLDEVNMSYARLSLAANQAGPTNDTYVKVAYDTEDELDAGFTHGSAGDLTLVDGGKYLVIANTYLGNSSNRTSLVQRLTLDGSEVEGSKTTVYLRNAQNANQGSASIGMILEATAGQVLNVEGSLDTNLGGMNYRGGRCALTVIKLPSLAAGTAPADPEYIRLRHEVDQDINATTDTALVFAIQDEGSSAFSHTGGGSAVTVNTDGDYLFFSSIYDDDDELPRTFYSQGWSVNGGAKLAYGLSGRYARNTGGADQFGNSSGLIASGLVATNTVEMVSSALGRNGVQNANRVGLQGVRIASLFDTNASFEVIIDPLIVNVAEGGATDTYDLSIGLPPASGSVDITVTADADTEVSLDGTNFFPSIVASFTSGGTPQTIHVRAFDDATPEVAETALISHAITATGDPANYPTTLPILDVEANIPVNDVSPVVAVNDTATVNVSEDATATEASLAPQASLIANDTDGLSNFVSSFDSESAMGAKVTVQPDGTFTYDPTASAMLQMLAGGGSAVDTFEYTVEDIDGNTDTGTFTITVDGANDAVEATDDFLNDGPLENVSSFVSSADLTQNDGIFRRVSIDYTFPPGSDLRLLPGKTVSQSPSVGTPPGNGVPENAFDGNIGSFTHTQSNNNTVDHVWQVDFGQDVSLETVTLQNRQDCCGERFRDITVTVLDNVGTEVFNSGLLNPANALGFTGNSGGSLFVDFAGPITGRTLVVTRTPDLADANAGNGSILSLGEVTVIGSVAGTQTQVDDLLLLNYEANQTSDGGRWENRGSRGGAVMDWLLTDVALNSSPGSTRAGISKSYEWDNATDAAVLNNGSGGDSIHDLIQGTDLNDATWEFWVKPDNASSVMTLFETGGGSGFGMIINNGVLEAATELDGGTMNGSYVSYNLLTDSMGLVGGDPTLEFNQYAVSIDIGGGGLALYVNGVKVDESTSGTSGDWDGGDGAGLGRFRGSNHGGFANGATGGTYDAPFLGEMAIVRLYEGILTPAQVSQNFKVVDLGTDIDGDSITATGVIDGTGTFVANGSQATLASGALVTMNDATGGFDYNPNGAFSLAPGQTTTDTFAYRVTDGNGTTADANVTVTITGQADSIDDNLFAKEAQMFVFLPNEFVKNDEIAATTGAYVDFTPPFFAGNTWTNTGSAGAARDGAVTGSVISAPDLMSAFEHIGCASTATNLATLDPISNGDATIEIWFRPEAGQTGEKTIFDTGGNGNGFSIVYNPATDEVTAKVDGGDDATANIVATAGGISTSEFNQVIVVIQPNGGAEVGVGTGIFEDLLTVYVNNDPVTGFDATVDASGINLLGIANDWAGTDAGGLNAIQGTTALNDNFPGAAGEVAIFRAYSRVLSLAEMEANFEAAIKPITAVTSPTTDQGATVTLNGDGTVTVDYTGISLAPGATLPDTFTYTTTGGTATVNVTIEGNTIQEDWRLLYYGSIDDSGPGADLATAVNGLTNLENFAQDLDPSAAAGSLDVDAGGGTITTLGQPSVWVDPADGRIYLRYVRRADYAAIPLAVTDEFSRDLATFENTGVATDVIATGTGASGAAIEAVQKEFPLILPNSGGKGRYGRINVTKP